MSLSDRTERDRLENLRAYQLLDTPPEPGFDRVAQLAARLAGTPMAVITLVDQGRQWFKATVGISQRETDRAVAFCAHAIEGVGHFVVPDALADPVFRDNPLVLGDPQIRFYHGVPLVSPGGYALGTLAVLDREPRELDELQREALDVLAEQVMAQMEQHRQRLRQEELSAELDRSAERYAELFHLNPQPMWIYDVETLAFLAVNDAAISRYGYSRDEFLSMDLTQIRPPEEVGRLRITPAQASGIERAGQWRHVRKDGSLLTVDITSYPVRFDDRAARLVHPHDLTDLEVAERQATELAGRLATTLDSIGDGFVLFDADWRLQFLNPAAARMLRVDREALTGAVLWEAFPELAGSRLEGALRQCLAQGAAAELEVHWTEMRAWAQVRVLRAPEGVAVYFTDVTERRAAEKATALMTSRLTTILGVWRSLSDGTSSLEELFDQIPHLVLEVLGAQAAVLLLAQDDRLVPRSMAGFPAGAPTLRLDSGNDGLALWSGSTVRSDDLDTDERVVAEAHRPDRSRSMIAAPIAGIGGPLGVIAVLDRETARFTEADERSLDILAQALGAVLRRTTEAEAVHLSEERFRLVSEATSDAVYDWELASGALWWNEGMSELIGWNLGSLDGDLRAEQLHPDDRVETLAAFRELIISGGDLWDHEYRFRRPDGAYLHLHDRGFLIRREDGRAVRLVGGITDITNQAEIAARTNESQRLEAIGQLTGGIAHDFNNLLTVVLGNADELVRELAEQPELQEFAEMSRTAALRGAELSHRLLAFARRQALEPRPSNLNDLLVQMDAFLRRTIPADVELKFVRGAGLWPALVDPGQLEAALVNLCLNARDAMPDGGRLTIETSNVRIDQHSADTHVDLAPGQYVMVAISDTGSGISGEHLDRVFEPFFSTKRKGAGTGMGLSMVHGFSKQSGGHVEISTEPGEGTTVRLYLPRAARSAEQGEDVSVPVGACGQERILLVEDDWLVRKLALRHLNGLGYRVEQAATGPEAMGILLAEEPFDLLFTDVVMSGGMSGRELADAALRHQPDLNVLFTSGDTEDEIVPHGRLDPGVQLLPKPYRLDELTRKLRSVLATPR